MTRVPSTCRGGLLVSDGTAFAAGASGVWREIDRTASFPLRHRCVTAKVLSPSQPLTMVTVASGRDRAREGRGLTAHGARLPRVRHWLCRRAFPSFYCSSMRLVFWQRGLVSSPCFRRSFSGGGALLLFRASLFAHGMGRAALRAVCFGCARPGSDACDAISPAGARRDVVAARGARLYIAARAGSDLLSRTNLADAGLAGLTNERMALAGTSTTRARRWTPRPRRTPSGPST